MNLGVPVRKAETASEIVIVSRHLSPSIIGRVAVRGHLAGKAAIIDGPEELAMRLTKTFSFVGDVILDPFLGSGITTVAAWRSGRNSFRYRTGSSLPEAGRRPSATRIRTIREQPLGSNSWESRLNDSRDCRGRPAITSHVS
ncbi:MAG: DNA methyltransferase [Limisphaerales bacterium]